MGVEGVHPGLAERLARDRRQRHQAVVGVGPGREATVPGDATALVRQDVAAQVRAFLAAVDPGLGERLRQRAAIVVPAAVLVAPDGRRRPSRHRPRSAAAAGRRPRSGRRRLGAARVEPGVEPRRADHHRADADDPPGRPSNGRSARWPARRGAVSRGARTGRRPGSSQGDSSASSSVPAPTAASSPTDRRGTGAPGGREGRQRRRPPAGRGPCRPGGSPSSRRPRAGPSPARRGRPSPAGRPRGRAGGRRPSRRRRPPSPAARGSARTRPRRCRPSAWSSVGSHWSPVTQIVGETSNLASDRNLMLVTA